MSLPDSLLSPGVHDAAALADGGADLLQLALMDARSRTLGWLAVFEQHSVQPAGPLERLDPPLWLIGHVAWLQEYQIGRHLQRRQGSGGRRKPRLASIEPRADEWFDPEGQPAWMRWRQEGPDVATLRDYLQATLDSTLELLERAEPTAAALAVFREALHHEDRAGERLAELAQALDLPPELWTQAEANGLWKPWPSRVRRDPIGLPGGRVQAGCADGQPGGEAGTWWPPAACGRLQERVPEFEIDAQPVSWAQWSEFVEDGGYDDRRWWTVAGWDWVESLERRAPRYVEQFSGGVLARRCGRLQRLPGNQPAMHVSAHEADAWCRWAGRRLPAEAEWRLAVAQGSGRGFVWGDVAEWMAGRAQPLAGGPATGAGDERVLRGASLQGSPRLKHADARRYALAAADEGFTGFRSCAV